MEGVSGMFVERWQRTDWHRALKHLQTLLGPLSYWFQVDTAIDECLC